jgi:hypothetical protein
LKRFDDELKAVLFTEFIVVPTFGGTFVADAPVNVTPFTVADALAQS